MNFTLKSDTRRALQPQHSRRDPAYRDQQRPDQFRTQRSQPAHSRPQLLAQARPLISDLFEHSPTRYWSDFLLSLVLGYTGAHFYLTLPISSPVAWGGFVVAVIALYRLGSFTHEIAHFKSHEMRSFRIAWDLLAGIPLLTPSYFYQSHHDHHTSHHYGTDQDGEYLPLGSGGWRSLIAYFLQVFVQPLAIVLRFLLTPLTFVHPRVREWTLRHASSLVIDFHYRRSIPADAPRRIWALMDLACFVRAALIFVLVFLGSSHWTRLPQLYFLAITILSLNYVRTLSAHRYMGGGQRMSHEAQVLDSTVITGTPVLTEFLCPLGTRYHALHHLFPRLPYHNLAEAHRRLMANLPPDSVYRDTVYPSWLAVVREFSSDLRSPATLRATAD